MNVDRSHFLLLTATLAAGAVGGWVARDRDLLVLAPRRATAEPIPRAEPAAVMPAPEVAPTAVAAAAPTCDDSVGNPEACPPMGPSAEGVAACSNLAAKRCADFKASFKPKVAENAVACLRRLKGGELCDAARVNLCGHAALMAACQDPTPAPVAAGATKPPPSAVVTASASIVASCASMPLAPTLDEARRTLSGMSDAGRASAVSCMASHCADKGLLGCEAAVEPKG